ncbi:hypothetical protein ABT289_34220 [Streptomyces fimicarius]|uniref:hypothetical protein n=1 Tax=Streptomyces griseus TaxID=1911 RepID=UPI00332A3DC3
MSVLTGVAYAAPHTTWLTPNKQMRMMTVASLVVTAVRVLAGAPGTAIDSRLAVIWTLLDHAIA